ncbi:MAG: hypothetical protein GC204_03140 [Chloroflexi bacterium]|nr:hypothetical protein [Chloroflexota bacterium]
MRKTYALLVVIAVFVPLAIAVMTLISIRPWVLDRSFYESLLDDEALYEVPLISRLPDGFTNRVLDAFTRDLFGAEELPAEALNAALPEVVTPDYLRALSLSAIETAFDFIDGTRSDLQIAIDFVPIRQALQGEAAAPFAANLAAALPPCAADQSPVASGGHLPRCIAADSSETAAVDQIVAALPALIDAMPDSSVLAADTNLQMGWLPYNRFLTSGIRSAVDVGIVALTVMALLAWLTGAYFGGADMCSRLKWASSSLFAPASLILFTGLALTFAPAVTAIGNSITTASYSEAYRNALIRVLVQVFEQVGTAFVVVGGFACVVAFALLVWSLFTPAGNRASVKIVQVPVRNG